MLIYHYSNALYPELLTRRQQEGGRLDKKKDAQAAQNALLYSRAGSYYDHISFFMDPIPAETIGNLFGDHHTWFNGNVLYEYVVDTADLPKMKFEVVETAAAIKLMDSQDWSKEYDDDWWIDYFKTMKELLVKEGSFGDSLSDLNLAIGKHKGKLEQYYQAARRRVDWPDAKKRYASSVPHLMIYATPPTGRFKYRSVSKVTIGERQRVSVEGERFPEILYHGSSFKHNNLKPGFDHTGVLVEWDKTESNKFLYADENNEEAISMAFASALEQKYKLDRYQTDGDTITITLAKGEKVIGKKDLAKLKIYIYIIDKSEADGWVKVNNEHNNSTTEWKTKKHIDRNLLGVKEIDVEDWLKRKEIKVSIEMFEEVHVSKEDDKKDDKDVGEDIQRIREFGEKKDLPEETINKFIVDELKENAEEKEKKVSNESLPKSFLW